jgi:hypothetical protein
MLNSNFVKERESHVAQATFGLSDNTLGTLYPLMMHPTDSLDKWPHCCCEYTSHLHACTSKQVACLALAHILNMFLHLRRKHEYFRLWTQYQSAHSMMVDQSPIPAVGPYYTIAVHVGLGIHRPLFL